LDRKIERQSGSAARISGRQSLKAAPKLGDLFVIHIDIQGLAEPKYAG
jgi:hypothetical protein